jgi:sulfite reductase (ferredoxin)
MSEDASEISVTNHKLSAESKNEGIKRQSRHLRGTIAETLDSDATRFGETDIQLLKFHGTYQQDDRDKRRARGADEAKSYSFMARLTIPGGILTAEQYLGLDAIADQHANGTLRVTTRQGIQYHGVLKGDLKPAIAGINELLATTLAACGDVERNVMACPAPVNDEAHAAVIAVARGIAEELRPATRAYHEIWLDGERQLTTQEEEPFYGELYLPRKFKTAIALSSDNCVDIYSHDVGLIAIVDDGVLRGFNLLVGGGLGMTHNKGDTMARLADPLVFVAPEHAVEAARTVAAIFRDYGNRADRRHARLKYLVAEWGLEKFRQHFAERVSFPIADPVELPTPHYHDHLGTHAQPDGHWFLGVFVQSGRIADTADQQLKTALRDVVTRYRPGVRFTPQQNVLLTDLSETAIAEIEAILKSHGVTSATELSQVRRNSLACPALPTCGLAVAESERYFPSVVASLEAELELLGLDHEPITVRMTGCPNGCARPYTADIAFVGRSLERYHIYVGGRLTADRVADLYDADVKSEDLMARLRPLLTRWARERSAEEGLGDFYQRVVGNDTSRRFITGREKPTRELVLT